MTHLWNTHKREKTRFVSGDGVFLVNKSGARYLDFNSGGAVNSLGYANAGLIKSLNVQASKIWHLSNYYYNEHAEKYAKKLCTASGFEMAFFTNSGTESNESAIKLARRYFYKNSDRKYEIIALENAFHGRTLGSLSATFNSKYRDGFGPLVPGFTFAKPNLHQIEEKITENTAAIILEPIQGEGGINFFGWEFLRKIRLLCNKYGILFILDEVQTGFGRTGKLFAFEHAGIKPDILTLAKGIAGGFPFGAVLTRKEISDSITPGSHGGTFGGNLLGISAATETLKQINNSKFLSNIQSCSSVLFDGLKTIQQKFPNIVLEIRGVGLMLGLVINPEIDVSFIKHIGLEEQQLLLGTSSFNVLRITPPLIITKQDIEYGLAKLHTLFSQF